MPIERLPVSLTEDERSRHAREASRLLGVYRERAERAKQIAAESRDELKELSESIEVHAKASRTGVEERDVEVRYEPDSERFVVHTVRVDTDERIHQRPMTEDEMRVARQGKLDLRTPATTSPLRGITRGGQPS